MAHLRYTTPQRVGPAHRRAGGGHTTDRDTRLRVTLADPKAPHSGVSNRISVRTFVRVPLSSPARRTDYGVRLEGGGDGGTRSACDGGGSGSRCL
ncbi:hypothetical protein SSCG_04504 [Streptomyces clavuligerus]|nr:hypothetical protein SSCG_04504 [Streptomyces clavuligerus]